MHRLIFSGLISILLAAPPNGEAENDRYAPPQAMILPTGFAITPMAAPEATFEPLYPGLHNFPEFVASGATTTVVSPDQKTLLVLTSGTSIDQIVRRIPTAGAAEFSSRNLAKYYGSAPISIALSPDERTLYVANGGTNSIAVINLAGKKTKIVGLMPTAYYPASVSTSGNGRWLYVVNGKSLTGPNPGNFGGHAAKNQFVEQLEKSGLLSFPALRYSLWVTYLVGRVRRRIALRYACSRSKPT
jgi:hypothetical protein